MTRSKNGDSAGWLSGSTLRASGSLWVGPSVMVANVVRLRGRFKRRAPFPKAANKQLSKRGPAHIDPSSPAPDCGSSKG